MGSEGARNMGGFTLVELLVVIAVIGVLASIAVLNFTSYRERAKIAQVASDLKNFESAFNAYLSDHDDYPADTNIVLPDGMSELISNSVWSATTALGGNYNWEGPNFYPYAGISITNPTAGLDKFLILDQMLDDGQIGVGRFRVSASNGRYTYIISE